MFWEKIGCALVLWIGFSKFNFKGFGNKQDNKTLWRCAVFGILWFVWLERNAHIFKSISLPLNLLWDSIVYMATIWCLAHGLFKGISFLTC